MSLRRVKEVCAAALMVSGLAYSQVPETPRILRPGESTTLRVDQANPVKIGLDLGDDKSARVVLREDEPSLQVRILDDHSREIRKLRAGYAGWMFISIPRSGSKRYDLAVEAPGALAGAVQVSISLDLGPASGHDVALQMQAEQVFCTAQATRREPTSDARRKAIALYQQARRLWLAGHSQDGQAVALGSEGETWLQLSHYTEALQRYALAEQLVRHPSTKEAWLLNGKTRIYMDRLQHQEALRMSEEALRTARTIHDSDGEGYALENLGETKYFLINQEGSKADLAQAMQIAEKKRDRVVMARILTIQGWQERNLGHLSQAMQTMLRADEFYQQTGDVLGSVGELSDIAVTDSMLGNPYSALVSHLKMAEFFRKSGHTIDEAFTAIAIGDDYAYINRPKEGLEYFKDALRIMGAIDSVWNTQAPLGLLCRTELTLNRVEEAKPHCQEVKRLADLYKVPVYISEADRSLGDLAQAEGHFSEAFSYYEQAAELIEKAHFPLGASSAVLSMGILKEKLADPRAAIDLFRRALKLSQNAEDPLGTIDARYQIAHSEASINQFEEAASELDIAIQLSEVQRLKVHDDKLKTSYFAAAAKCYDLYVNMLMRQHEQQPNAGFDRMALEKSEAGRGRTLLDSLVVARGNSPERNRAKADPELARLHAALNDAYEKRLGLIVGGKNEQAIQDNVAEIRRLAREYDRAVDAGNEHNQAPVAEVHPLTASQILEQSATSKSVILEYALGDKRSYLWRIDQGKLSSSILPDRKTISAAVQKWRDLVAARQRRAGESFTSFQLRVRNSDRELPRQSAQLSCMLLPGLPSVQDGRLVIVADGVLQSLPFSALPLDGCQRVDGAPVLSAYEVTNSPSVSVLAAGGKSGQDFSGDVAILADPVFSSSDPRVGNHNRVSSQTASLSALQSVLRDVGYGSELPRLNATRLEADAIAAALPTARLLLATDFKANLQTALSDEMAQYRIWHFATHGLLDLKSPDLSGLVFSLVDSAGRPTPGYLKTQDIFELSIHTDLVVLSACNSGLGEQVDGEGTIGLSYAFLHAGARQVMSTLWNIDDKASSDLMAEFYRALLTEHLSASAALRKAQNAMLLKKRNAEAFYWAGYVLTSN